MIREFTCIMCPRGCEITGELEEGKEPVITGNACPKGADYVKQEMVDPMRNIASSVRITGAEEPVVSVRLNHPVPKSRIFDVMAEIRKAEVTAPVWIGDVVIKDVLGLGSDVIITKNVVERD